MELSKLVAVVERVRRLRIEVPELARVIEVSSVEDYKARGWGRPLAHIEGPGGSDDARIAAHELPALTAALTRAFELFDREFGAQPAAPVVRVVCLCGQSAQTSGWCGASCPALGK